MKCKGCHKKTGKTRFNTPKVNPDPTRPKAKVGRAKKRALYNKRFKCKGVDKMCAEDFLAPAEVCRLFEKNRGKWWLM